MIELANSAHSTSFADANAPFATRSRPLMNRISNRQPTCHDDCVRALCIVMFTNLMLRVSLAAAPRNVRKNNTQPKRTRLRRPRLPFSENHAGFNKKIRSFSGEAFPMGTCDEPSELRYQPCQYENDGSGHKPSCTGGPLQPPFPHRMLSLRLLRSACLSAGLI